MQLHCIGIDRAAKRGEIQPPPALVAGQAHIDLQLPHMAMRYVFGHPPPRALHGGRRPEITQRFKLQRLRVRAHVKLDVGRLHQRCGAERRRGVQRGAAAIIISMSRRAQMQFEVAQRHLQRAIKRRVGRARPQ